MNAKDVNDAKLECQNDPFCQSFYDHCGRGKEFYTCDDPLYATTSTCGSILYRKENIETCFDGIKNQGEDEIDCGGPCYECDANWIRYMRNYSCSGERIAEYSVLQDAKDDCRKNKDCKCIRDFDCAGTSFSTSKEIIRTASSYVSGSCAWGKKVAIDRHILYFKNAKIDQ